MLSRFLPLFTPVVFIACLCSGRLEPEKKRIQMKIYDPSVPPTEKQLSCFCFAPSHGTRLEQKQIVCKLQHLSFVFRQPAGHANSSDIHSTCCTDTHYEDNTVTHGVHRLHQHCCIRHSYTKQFGVLRCVHSYAHVCFQVHLFYSCDRLSLASCC